jgi:hypothetical protein
VENRLGESDTLEHPLGIGIEPFSSSFGESYFLESPGFAFCELGFLESIESTIEVEELISSQVLVEIGILGHKSDFLLYARISW